MKDDLSRDQDSFFHRLAKSLGPFAKDYMERHRHPVNAALHIVGVPAVLYGIFQTATGRSGRDRGVGLALVVFGYFLQYLGHKRQGNEVGEISLIKYLVVKLKEASRKRMRSHDWFGGAEETGDKSPDLQTVSTGKTKGGNGNGNGHHGGNGNSSSSGRYILWWKTSH